MSIPMSIDLAEQDVQATRVYPYCYLGKTNNVTLSASKETLVMDSNLIWLVLLLSNLLCALQPRHLRLHPLSFQTKHANISRTQQRPCSKKEIVLRTSWLDAWRQFLDVPLK
mmetsp:Transcript_17767/g.50597  ORF Transcript_17767/g.50597 Transcript_17767/m.50597 type:complete len:112 (+) Transcript_17767:1104-1439(+)